MVKCIDCGEVTPAKRLILIETDVCLECAKLREEDGNCEKNMMVQKQEIKGWTFEGVENEMVKTNNKRGKRNG